jgi:hypothetical protein
LYASVLRDIERNLCDGKARKTLRGVYIHFGNAPAHNAKQPPQEIVRSKATRVMHPADYPDGAPSDFFLSGHLYEKRAGFIANSPADILSDIRRIFQEISKKPFEAGYDGGSHGSSG